MCYIFTLSLFEFLFANAIHESPDNAVLRILYDQHRVAKGEKAIFLSHGSLISLHHGFLVIEGGHQHQQRAFRQVEIGDQRIHRAEAIAGINKLRPGR